MPRKKDGKTLHQSYPSNTDPPNSEVKVPDSWQSLRWLSPVLDKVGAVVVSVCLSAHAASRGVVDPVHLGFIYEMAVFSIGAYLLSRLKS